MKNNIGHMPSPTNPTRNNSVHEIHHHPITHICIDLAKDTLNFTLEFHHISRFVLEDLRLSVTPQKKSHTESSHMMKVDRLGLLATRLVGLETSHAGVQLFLLKCGTLHRLVGTKGY